MSAVVWANVLLVIPFLIAFIAIPLWITLRRQSTPDHSQAHAYLRAKAALAEAGTAPVTSVARPGRRPWAGPPSAAAPRPRRAATTPGRRIITLALRPE